MPTAATTPPASPHSEPRPPLSGIPSGLDGHQLLRAAEIRLGDLLVPVGAPPARTDCAFVLPSDTYLIGQRTTAEGLSPARLFHVYRADAPQPPLPVPEPAPAPSYPSIPYTPSAPHSPLAALTQAALHLATALQILAGLQTHARPPAPE